MHHNKEHYMNKVSRKSTKHRNLKYIKIKKPAFKIRTALRKKISK